MSSFVCLTVKTVFEFSILIVSEPHEVLFSFRVPRLLRLESIVFFIHFLFVYVVSSNKFIRICSFYMKSEQNFDRKLSHSMSWSGVFVVSRYLDSYCT